MVFDGGATQRRAHVANGISSLISRDPSRPRLLILLLILALFAPTITSSLAQRRRPILRSVAGDYFAGKFVLIPRDERPSSLQQPRMLARVADHDLIVPPARAMASADKLIEWAKTVDYAEADGAIIALDAIAGAARGQREIVDWIRARGMPVYAFISGSSDQLTRTALNLVAESALDFLLISGAGASRERLSNEIAALGLSDNVAIEPDVDMATANLLSRLLNRRFGFTPTILPVFSSAEGQNSTIHHQPLHREVSLAIKAAGGAVPSQSKSPQSNDAERNVDALLFVHTPLTPEANRSALIEAIARNIEIGAIVAIADLSETSESKDAVIAELRRRKLLDKLIAYASSDPGVPGDDPAEAISRAVTHASAFLNAVRFMRDDIARVRRFDRAHFNLLFNHYLCDWAYALNIRPRLDEFVKAELKADPNRLEDATERAEAFAFEEVKLIAEDLFNDQFRRNIHAILLSTGERVKFELVMLQRLQVRFITGKTSEAEIRQSVYIPQLNFLDPLTLSSSDVDAGWSMKSEIEDERIVKRFESTDWERFKTDVEEVEVTVKLSPRQGAQESYTISSARRRNSRRVMITAPSEQGVFYALSKLEMIGAEGGLAGDFQITESPKLARRGVAEPIRGAPWSHRDRLDMIRFLGLARMNRYVCAPDGERWREDYDDEALERFGRLLRTAEENFVRVVYAVTPGRSVAYSSATDASALIRKLEAMAELGARGYALRFDDLPSTLQNDHDRARFRTLASAQAHLINLVHGFIQGRLKQSGADFEFYVAPSIVADPRLNGDYLKELVASTPQDVLFFQPGADSPEGANERASAWSGIAGRRLVVLDNFASDVDQPWRLFPGAARVASPAVNEDANGYIITAMSQTRASMLPITTAADYAWDSINYNPQRSHDRALNLLYDERARKGLRVWTHLPADGGDSVFKPLFQKQAGEINIESMERKLDDLQGALGMIGVALNQGLLRGEMARFISQTRSAIENLKNDPNYEKLSNGNYRLREK